MAKPKTKRAAQSQQDADAAKHAPVSLPSGGSFDREALQEGLDKAADGHADNRDAEVAHALESARTDATHTSAAPSNTLPGHKVVNAEVQLAPGSEVGSGDDKVTVGAVVVNERRQVLDPDADQDLQSAASGGQPVVGGHSKILSTEDASGFDDSHDKGEHEGSADGNIDGGE